MGEGTDRGGSGPPAGPAPLPAAQVRRLGDRHRRRRGWRAAIVMVAAILGLSLVVVALPRDAEEPGRQQYASAPEFRDDIPADFSLTLGWSGPDTRTSTGEEDPEAATLPSCSDVAAPTPADVSVAATGSASRGTTRTLAVYASTADAVEALAIARDAVLTCDAYEQRATVAADGLGDEVAAARYVDSHGNTAAIVVVRVSNTVLISTGSNGPDVNAMVAADAQVVEAMERTFGREPDTATSPPSGQGGRDRPDSTGDSANGTEDGTGVLDPSLLVRLEDLPTRSGYEDWYAEDPVTDELTFACQPGRLRDLLGIEADGYAEFTADLTLPAGSTADPEAPAVRDAAVNTGVLRFSDEATAAQAYASVQDWLANCEAVIDDLEVSAAATPLSSADAVDPSAQAEWWAYSYVDPTVCDADCDAVRDHAMGVALLGRDLVLVSFAQANTGSGPTPSDDIEDLLLRALIRASDEG